MCVMNSVIINRKYIILLSKFLIVTKHIKEKGIGEERNYVLYIRK